MITQEYDAKEKWCPFVRLGFSDDSSVNRSSKDGIEKSSRCIGSRCMMWRFSLSPNLVVEDGEDEGYCGLAGVPIKRPIA
jgi:hypothetical protein